MKTTYDPQQIESTWYAFWEDQQYFAPTDTGQPYSIAMPPPNVTGSLHMGHAFQHAIMDALARCRRMQGHSVLWQVGTDHAGIATQMLVERKLKAEKNQTRHDVGRDAFIDAIWQWKAQSGGTITQQMRRLGDSVDWENERFTMDEGFNQAVQKAFEQLFDEGLLYRGKRLVNWDSHLQTAISDLEVESRDQQGHIWYFRYPLADNIIAADGFDHIVIATTRPETLLGDVAVAVHPDDERYRNLIGQHVILPLVGRRIPIVSDTYVDPEFGTGCVKITPAHDFNDYELGQRHQLPLINVMTLQGHIREHAEVFDTDGRLNTQEAMLLPEAYAGLDRFAARDKIIADMEALNWLVRAEKHANKIPYGDRSGVVIEPLLTDQWFIRIQPLADPAIEAVRNGDIQFVPKSYENMYFSWMKDVKDWCISRQLWWGHRIPAFYDESGQIYVAADEAAARRKYQLADDLVLHQDNDVLDTWFSASLWSFATLGWPEATKRLQRFHPTDVLVTGFDIIFFWVARMIMMSLHLLKDAQGTPQVPFKTVYVTGLIRDAQGQKMSKSKGNVLDPLDMIDGISLDDLLQKQATGLMQPQMAKKIAQNTRKQFPEGIAAHGTDALRFTLFSLASTGRDINWDMKRLEGYRNFCNKLWNAARYVLMHTESQDCGAKGGDIRLSLADEWIMARLQQTVQAVTQNLDNLRFDLASHALYEFIWNDYCDWYLELTKPALWNEHNAEAILRGTRRTLIQVLETILRLAHPFIPYITEAIWQQVKIPAGVQGDSIMVQPFPTADSAAISEHTLADMDWLQRMIVAVRNIRGEMNLPMGKALDILLTHANATDKERLHQHQSVLQALAKLNTLRVLDESEAEPLSVTAFVGDMRVLVPMAGLIDTQAECARLEKELGKLEADRERLQNKLTNAQFIERAPAEVVQKEREKLADMENKFHALTDQHNKISQLNT